MNHSAESSILVDVSRETIGRLREYEALVAKWNPAINLVSKTSLADLWSRHILDSVQVFSVAPQRPAIWADLGSGAGFPGVVAAILAADLGWDTKFTLIESDQRKAAFLRTVNRNFQLDLSVTAERIEKAKPLNAMVLTARALAPLPDLLGYASPHLSAEGVAIFPKGRTSADEIAAARALWDFDLVTTASKTDPDAQILTVTRITRAQS